MISSETIYIDRLRFSNCGKYIHLPLISVLVKIIWIWFHLDIEHEPFPPLSLARSWVKFKIQALIIST